MHRDFKVDNLFMHDDTIIIADLGFAKKGKEMTQTACGTPMYMAPEIFEGKDYTNLADLWSVGVSFYELLFGKFPFNAMSQPALLQDIKKHEGSKLPIDKSINHISADCEDLLRRTLTYDTKRRMTWNEFFNHKIFNDNKPNPNSMQPLLDNGGKNRNLIQLKY